MKIDELFKKAEKFFSMDEKKQEKKRDKKEKLSALVDKKIASVQGKIEEAHSDKKLKELQKKMDILLDLQKKL
jgi:hypothetical protein